VTTGQSFRTKSLTAKVTEEEYARLLELATAAGQSMGEWARTVLLAQVNSSQEIGKAQERLSGQNSNRPSPENSANSAAI
jgi:hypothetical protein